MKSGILATFLVFFMDSANAVNWSNSWESEKAGSARECARIFKGYQMQAVCMGNQIRGYKKLQGNFGMPENIANKAKKSCARTFHNFYMQSVCMGNEKKGYERMQQY